MQQQELADLLASITKAKLEAEQLQQTFVAHILAVAELDLQEKVTVHSSNNN